MFGILQFIKACFACKNNAHDSYSKNSNSQGESNSSGAISDVTSDKALLQTQRPSYSKRDDILHNEKLRAEETEMDNHTEKFFNHSIAFSNFNSHNTVKSLYPPLH